MAVPVGIFLSAAIRVTIRMLPKLRSLYFIAARQGMRTTLRRKLLVGAEYTRRLLTPVKSNATFNRLIRKGLNTTREDVKQYMKAYKRAFAKRRETKNVQQTLKQLIKGKAVAPPSKKFLITNLAADISAAAFSGKAIVGQERQTVIKTLEQRRNAMDKKAEETPDRPKGIKQPTPTSSGGLIYVRAHTRNGKRVAGYYRRA